MPARASARRRKSPESPSSRLADRVPYVAAVRAEGAPPDRFDPDRLRVATYNVHRWTGARGGRKYDPALAGAVLGELKADLIAVQEALRPFGAEDPLEDLARRLGYHYAFVTSRIHKRGELGNAILTRWPLSSVFAIDLTTGRLERRSALAAEVDLNGHPMSLVATHLAIVDRTRKRQVQTLLEHPRLVGPVVLAGDMNAWRKRPTRALDVSLHHNNAWVPTFPTIRPVLALDRIYSRGARVERLKAHESEASRRGSDHLPLVATVRLEGQQ